MTTAERILTLLATRPRQLLTPAEIVVKLGVAEQTAYKTLTRMRQRGQLVRSSFGAYHMPGVKPEVKQRPGRRLLWVRLLEIEERVGQLERLASDTVP